MKLDYLITGTGRCGTVYLAHVLTSVGMPCGHESVFGHHGLERALKVMSGEKGAGNSGISRGSGLRSKPRDFVAESSYLSAPFIDHESLKDTKVIHIVRNPIRVIPSFVWGFSYFGGTTGTVYENFIYRTYPELASKELTPIDRASMYYILWNRMIRDKRPDSFLHKVEDPILPLLDYLGCPDKIDEVCSKKNLNARKRGMAGFNLERISSSYVRDELTKISEEYGYPISSSRKLFI